MITMEDYNNEVVTCTLYIIQQQHAKIIHYTVVTCQVQEMKISKLGEKNGKL